MSTYIFVLMIIVVLCFLLIIIVLSQNPKGGGLSGTFGGGGTQMLGVQRTNDFMDKATWTLSISIVVLIFLSTVLVPRTLPQKIEAGEATKPATEQTAPATETTPAADTTN